MECLVISLWRYARYWGPFALKLAGTILRHTFCDTEIEIFAKLVPVETENTREHIHIKIKTLESVHWQIKTYGKCNF